jgi:hypothetical protein
MSDEDALARLRKAKNYAEIVHDGVLECRLVVIATSPGPVAATVKRLVAKLPPGDWKPEQRETAKSAFWRGEVEAALRSLQQAETVEAAAVDVEFIESRLRPHDSEWWRAFEVAKERAASLPHEKPDDSPAPNIGMNLAEVKAWSESNPPDEYADPCGSKEEVDRFKQQEKAHMRKREAEVVNLNEVRAKREAEAKAKAESKDEAKLKAIPGFSDWWIDPTQIPRRQWRYAQHYVDGFASATIADGGVGKSTQAIAELVAMATGRNLLGVEVKERVKVWYHNGEEPREEIARRIHAVCKHYGINPKELVGWLHFTSGLDDYPIRIATAGKKGVVVNAKLAGAIVEFIEGNGFKVMVVDPLISCHACPENDNVAMDIVAKTFGRMAALSACGIDMCHHTRKALKGGDGQNFSADARGAGSLMNAVRCSRVLNVMSEKEAGAFGIKGDARLDYFRSNRGKSNMVRRGGASWFKLVSVEIGNGDGIEPGDNVQTIEEWTPNFFVTTAEHKKAVCDKVAAGEYRRDRQSKSWVGLVIAEVCGFDAAVQREQIEDIIKAWVVEGVLKEVTRPDSKRMPRVFVEVGDATAGDDD